MEVQRVRVRKFGCKPGQGWDIVAGMTAHGMTPTRTRYLVSLVREMWAAPTPRLYYEAASVYLISRGRSVQALPAICPVASSYQAQAHPAQDNRTAGNPLATTLLTAAAYHILRGAMLASKDCQPDTGRPQQKSIRRARLFNCGPTLFTLLTAIPCRTSNSRHDEGGVYWNCTPCANCATASERAMHQGLPNKG